MSNRHVSHGQEASPSALQALARVEQLLRNATASTPVLLLAVMRELSGTDPLTVEVGRAGTVERLLALGVADAEAVVDAGLRHCGLIE